MSMQAGCDPAARIRRFESRKPLRQPLEAGWLECFDYSYPERGHGLNGTIITGEDIQKKKNRILDDTAADSARTLGSNIVSGTTPANSLWFGLDAGQETDDEKRWLDASARFIFENIHGSNFDACAFECAIDVVAAGWFVLYIDQKPEGGYLFEQWAIAQCYISASKLGGLIDTIDREVEMTVEQVVTSYGLDNVSDQVAQAYHNEKYDEKIKVVHSIYPRALYVVGSPKSKNLPFASTHIELATKKLLRESGYHEFPCVVPRWMGVPGSAYATGPMSKALGSIRTVNDIKALELSHLDMELCGMYVAEDDGVLNPATIKLGPRRVIVANSVDSIKELNSKSNFNVSFTSQDREQAQIRKIMLADTLPPADGPAKTAYEYSVRVQMLRQLLGPIYGRLQAEYLKPMIDRCFGLAFRAGVLGEPPESLRGRVFSVTYISPLARAQKMEEAAAVDQFVGGAVALAEVHPEVLDTIDFDEAQKVKGEALGVPSRVMRSDKDIASIRIARQKKQEAAQEDAMQNEVMAKAAPGLIQKAVA